MFRLPLLVLLLCYDAAQAFVGAPALLNTGRGKAVYTKGWGSKIARHTNAARLAMPHRGLSAAAPPSMSLMLLSEVEEAAGAAAAAAAGDLPVSPEQQESIISVLSVASSVLLLVIICGAVYLSLAEWKNKKELEETTKYTGTGQLPPDLAPEASAMRSDAEEEGNRLQRRMAKKEKRKSGKI